MEGAGGACWAEGTACDCDRVRLGRLQQAKICVSLGLWPCGGRRGAVRPQGWLDWGGLGKHEACPGCCGRGPCPSSGMGLGAPTGQQVESSSWSRDGEGAVEPRVPDKGRKRKGKADSEGVGPGASWKWEGPGELGEKLDAGFGGLPDPPGTLSAAPVMGLGRRQAGGWGLGPPERPDSCCPQPPSQAPWGCTSLLPASLGEAPSCTRAFPTSPLGPCRCMAVLCDSRQGTGISPSSRAGRGVPIHAFRSEGLMKEPASGAECL